LTAPSARSSNGLSGAVPDPPSPARLPFAPSPWSCLPWGLSTAGAKLRVGSRARHLADSLKGASALERRGTRDFEATALDHSALRVRRNFRRSRAYFRQSEAYLRPIWGWRPRAARLPNQWNIRSGVLAGVPALAALTGTGRRVPSQRRDRSTRRIKQLGPQHGHCYVTRAQLEPIYTRPVRKNIRRSRRLPSRRPH